MSTASFTAGVAAYRATSYEAALDLFSEVGSDCQGRVCVSVTCTRTRSSQHRSRASGQAIAQDSQQPRYFDARANTYEKLGRIKDALLDARQVIKLAPTSYKVKRPSRADLGSSTAHVIILQGFLRAGRLFRLSKKYSSAEKVLVDGQTRLGPHDDKVLKVRAINGYLVTATLLTRAHIAISRRA